MPASSGTAMRTWSGRPKLVQSRTTTPSGASRSTQPGRAAQHPRGVRRLCRDAVAAEQRDEFGPAGGDRLGPGGEVDSFEKLGEQRDGEAVEGPVRLAAGEALGVVSEDVADAQAGAGEHLGERAHHDPGAPRRPRAGREWVEASSHTSACSVGPARRPEGL